MMAYLTDSEVYATQSTEHRFIVELASDELELDAWGIPVPKDFKVVDVLVAAPTKKAIEKLVEEDAPHLKGYSVIDYWQPEDGDCPF